MFDRRIIVVVILTFLSLTQLIWYHVAREILRNRLETMRQTNNKCLMIFFSDFHRKLGPASSTNIVISQRKNHPLFHETIRWKSDVPLTEGQLRSKRDEFWETAPAFEGEILLFQ